LAKKARRLTRQNPTVNKTVAHNGAAESKKLQIANWAKELNLFTESDINKPAWKEATPYRQTTIALFTKPNIPN
jgi:hypothetical protein